MREVHGADAAPKSNQQRATQQCSKAASLDAT